MSDITHLQIKKFIRAQSPRSNLMPSLLLIFIKNDLNFMMTVNIVLDDIDISPVSARAKLFLSSRYFVLVA